MKVRLNPCISCFIYLEAKDANFRRIAGTSLSSDFIISITVAQTRKLNFAPYMNDCIWYNIFRSNYVLTAILLDQKHNMLRDYITGFTAIAVGLVCTNEHLVQELCQSFISS